MGAHVLFGIQEHATVIAITVGLLPQTFYMQESSPSIEHHSGRSDSSLRQSVASSTIH